MHRPIGEIIRSLRKEREMTQEELAELLSVTAQSVSKWERGESLPDIAQIVPLASIFDVSTDVLFALDDKREQEAVRALIEAAEQNVRDDNRTVTAAGLYRAYTMASEGLTRYPGNLPLLMYILERGIALAYPENDCFDAAHAEAIYRDCIRIADRIIRYGRNTTDILRAHMIMVLLHAAYGDYARAEAHAAQFPWRADMTVHEMQAYIAHAKRDYADESRCCQRDTMYHLEAMLDDITQNGCARMAQGQYSDAITCFRAVFALIETTFAGEPVPPPLHFRERGDVGLLMAEAYLGLGDRASALHEIERAVDYETDIRPTIERDRAVTTPLLREVEHTFYWQHMTRRGYLDRLASALAEARFAPLHADPEFARLLARLN